MKVFTEKFKAQDYLEKGLKALGVRVTAKEVESITVEAQKKSE